VASEVQERQVDYAALFVNFVENFKTPEGYAKYYERVWQMIRMGQKSLVVDFDDLILYNAELAEKLIEEPSRVLEAFSSALKAIVCLLYA